MTDDAIPRSYSAKRNWSDIGLAITTVLSVPLAMIVEELSLIMARSSAVWSAFGVLALFAAPLITAWAAIGISLASRPLQLRIAVAAVLLLLPPALLFGVFNG